MKIIQSFYENVYSKRERKDNNKIKFSDYITNLKEESREVCEGKVTKIECNKVLKEMKFNKSPDNDGFTVESTVHSGRY